MDEKDWLILKLLYEKRSITQTAKSLSISQPALSNRLQQMEARFGTPIVLRSTKGVHFTPQGEYLADCAHNMLKFVQTIDEHLNNMNQTPSGLLRIGASTFSAKYILPELLRRFKEQYPLVDFKVITGYSRDIVKHLYENNLHLAFIRGEYDWSEKHLLWEEKMYIASLHPLELANLPTLPQIDYPNDYAVKMDLNKWWHDHYKGAPYVGMEVDNADTCQEMVAKGLGYAFLPGRLVEKTNRFRLYEMFFKTKKPVTRKTWLFYNTDVMGLNVVKTFYDFVLKTDFANL